MLKNLMDDVRTFRAVDLIVGVITGVVAWAYMLVGSPLINSVAQGMGPLGLFFASFLLAVLYVLLTLGYPIRKSGLVFLVAMLVQAGMRLITGDPFGFIALQAYIIGGPLIWFATLGWSEYKSSFWRWVWIGALCHLLVDGIFYFYLGVAPVAGSMTLGYIWAFGGASLLTGVLIALIQLAIYPMLSGTKAIKQIWVKSRADRLRGAMPSTTASQAV
ncbi:MAG: hypothetical protein WDN46_24605 [Methylocella sp.]